MFFVFVLFIIVVRVFTLGMIHFFNESKVKECGNLFYPNSGDLQIKTVNSYEKDGKLICEEQTLKGIVYAQLRLYPTIGCEKPTLFYLKEGETTVKKMVVSKAELVK